MEQNKSYTRREAIGAGALLLASGWGGLAGANTRTSPREIEGVRFEPMAQIGGQQLMLNGVGVRKRFFLSVYVAGLYVPERSSDPETLLKQKGPRRMLMRFIRDVEAELFSTSLNEGMRRNYSTEQLNAWRPQLTALNQLISSMVLVRAGDMVSWDYVPGEGGKVVQNMAARVPSVQGEEFYNAVLRVWLGEVPADVDLKRGLLSV